VNRQMFIHAIVAACALTIVPRQVTEGINYIARGDQANARVQAWHNFLQHSFVQLDGREFLNLQWFRNCYHLASVTRSGSMGPGLFGPWAPEDFPTWGNDRHWDYNVQTALWGAFSCNHLKLTRAYSDEIFDLIPCVRTYNLKLF